MADDPAVVAADPVDLTEGGGDPDPAPAPAAFDVDAEIPTDALPEGIRESLKGKSTKDMGELYAKSREYVSKLGARNKELEAALKAKGEKKSAEELSDDELDAMLEERQTAQQVQAPDYKEVLDAYFETDEIPEEFLDAVEKNGVRVNRDDIADFMRWRKDRRQEMIDSITAATEGKAEGQDLWDWMESEECTISREMLKGFNGQARESDYSWVPLAAKKLGEFIEGGGKVGARRVQSRFGRGPVRRGKPPAPKPGEGDISESDFKVEWMKLSQQQASNTITKADEIRAKKVLESRRRRTVGDA